MDASGNIRIGIIGFGAFAERSIAPAIRASGGAELVAIQKRSQEAAQLKAAEHHVPLAFGTAEELAAHPDVDAVFIGSANVCHHAETLAAARAGKHVLVEKPMAMTVREAEEMRAVCAEERVILMVGHMIRLSPLVRRVRDLVQAGALGAIVRVRADFSYDGRQSKRGWLWDRSVAGGGPLYDIGVHCLDTLRYILDDEVARARCELAPLPTAQRTEATAELLLRFRKGAVGSITSSFAVPVWRCDLEVVGSEGIARSSKFNLGKQRTPLMITMGNGGGDGETREEMFDVPDLYVEEIRQFVACIRSGNEPELSGRNGLENQRILEQAAGSAAL